MRGSHKRGSDESWVAGRGGIGRGSRNTPGGRGWSPENRPRDGPTTPPPDVGGMGDPPPRNDLAPVHPSGDTIAVGDSGVEGSGSDNAPWRPKFMLGSASSEKKPPTPPSPSRSGEDRWGTPSPSRSGEDRWGASSRSEGDWRHGSVSLTPPHLTRDRNSSATPPHPKSRSDGDWRVRSASSTPSHPTLSDRSSSGTPPYPTRSDVKSWRKESDDSPLTPLKLTTVTGWPQRPVPELIVALLTPGILGRAPLPTREKLLKQESLYTEPAAPPEPSTPQSSTDLYDAAEGDPEDDQYDAAEREGAPEEVLAMWQDAVEAMWQDAVVEFLNVYIHPGHQSEFYKAQLAMAKLLGKFDITVEFDHLKAWNKNLASIICNGQGRDDHWLKQALSLFLNEHGEDSEDATIIFRNMPKSLKKGRDIFCTSDDLVTEVKYFKGRETAITSSYRCAQIVDAIITELLARLSFGVSWLGELTMEDIEFTETGVNGLLKATITREPEMHQGATGAENILDFYSLWPMIEPAVTLRGRLPLYFDELMDDLFSVTAEEVTEPWFHDYIAYHPSLVASMGRRNVEIGLYQTVSTWDLDRTPELQSVFAQKPAMDDWRQLAQLNPYLKVNFKHGNPGASKDSKEDLVKANVTASVATQDRIIEEQAEVVGQQKVVADGGYQDVIVMETVSGIADDSAGDASKDVNNDKVVSGSSGTPKSEVGNLEGLAKQKQNTEIAKMVSGMEKSVGKDPLEDSRYGNTLSGLLEFRRHVHTHPRVRRDDIDECEIFLAGIFSIFLCKTLRELLKTCRMTGKFEPVWSAYKASKADPRRLSTPTNTSYF